MKGLRLGRVDVVHGDILVSFEVAEEPIRSAVQVVPSDDFISSFQ